MEDFRPNRRRVLLLGGAFALASCTTESPRAANPPATSAPAAPAATTATPAATTPGAIATSPPATAAPTITPSCVLTPALTEGPYFVDEKLNRSDIRQDPSNNAVSAGALLRLNLQVVSVNGTSCAPLGGALLDVWQCDAEGVYSDVTDRGFSTRGKKFLRGFQTTDANGVAQFTTIYPGWYSGRAIHIHFKVRATANNRPVELTSQWFFDDTLSDQVFTQAPYNARGNRDTRNSNDGIYRGTGPTLVLPVQRAGDSYGASYVIGVRMA